MSDYLPIPEPNPVPAVRRVQVARQTRRAEASIVRHELAMWVTSENAKTDAMAVSDAVRCALHEEFDLLDDIMVRAGDSQTKRELGPRKLGLLAAISDHRLRRSFGR